MPDIVRNVDCGVEREEPLTPDDTGLLARNLIFQIIDQLKNQSGLSQQDAAGLILGYTVQWVALVTDDPEALLAICKESIANSVAVKHAFMPKNREPANPTEGAAL